MTYSIALTSWLVTRSTCTQPLHVWSWVAWDGGEEDVWSLPQVPTPRLDRARPLPQTSSVHCPAQARSKSDGLTNSFFPLPHMRVHASPQYCAGLPVAADCVTATFETACSHPQYCKEERTSFTSSASGTLKLAARSSSSALAAALNAGTSGTPGSAASCCSQRTWGRAQCNFETRPLATSFRCEPGLSGGATVFVRSGECLLLAGVHTPWLTAMHTCLRTAGKLSAVLVNVQQQAHHTLLHADSTVWFTASVGQRNQYELHLDQHAGADEAVLAEYTSKSRHFTCISPA